MLAARASVLVLQTGCHRLAEKVAIHAIERFPEHDAEDGEAEVALLHAARVGFRGSHGESFQQDGQRGHGGCADVGECFRRLDAQPEVVVFQQGGQLRHGGGGVIFQQDERLAGTVARFESRARRAFLPVRRAVYPPCGAGSPWRRVRAPSATNCRACPTIDPG